MSNLIDLVPPLELCKKIPAGEFEDSELVWRVPNSSFPLEDEFYEVHERDKCESWMKDKQIPAPTSEEILQELVNLSVHRINVCKSWGEWHIDCYDGERLIEKDSVKNITTASLKLWLKMKRVEA